MNPQDAVEMGREAIQATMMVGGPILIAGLLVGLIMGIVQAMTQVQDQSISFVPKVLAIVFVLALTLPWLSEKMVDYTHSMLEKPMIQLPSQPSTSDSFTTDV